jgi:RNA recognition motif-containing protein
VLLHFAFVQNHAYFVSNSVFRVLHATPPTISSLPPPLLPSPVLPLVDHHQHLHSASSSSSSSLPSKPVATVEPHHHPSSSLQQRNNATDILKSVIHDVSPSSSPSHAINNGSGGAVATTVASSSSQINASTHNDATHELEGEVNKKEERSSDLQDRSDHSDSAVALLHEDEDEAVPSYEEVTHQAGNPSDVFQKESKDKDKDEEPEVSSGAKTYSDIVKRLAKQAAQSSSSLPLSSDNSKQPSFKVIRSSKPLESAASSNNNKTGGMEKAGDATSRSFNHERGGYSSNLSPYAIYVGGLPDPVNEGDLSRVFSVYGKVTSVDIARGRKYAFIRFDNVASMQSALDHAIPVELNGHSLQAEEKTHKYPPNRNDSSRRREREKERDNINSISKGTEKKFVDKSSTAEKSPKGKNGDLISKQQKGPQQLPMKKEGETDKEKEKGNLSRSKPKPAGEK